MAAKLNGLVLTNVQIKNQINSSRVHVHFRRSLRSNRPGQLQVSTRTFRPPASFYLSALQGERPISIGFKIINPSGDILNQPTEPIHNLTLIRIMNRF